MKWSRPGAAGASGADESGVSAVASGGFTPRTLAKKQAELKAAGGDRKLLISELKDCDDQLEQIEIEKGRLADAADEDPDIADALEEHLQPRGVLVVMEAEHLCMSMRGVRKAGSSTVTSSVTGIFRANVATCAEAMRFLGQD